MMAGLGVKLQAVVYTYMYILDVLQSYHIHMAFELSEMLRCPVHTYPKLRSGVRVQD